MSPVSAAAVFDLDRTVTRSGTYTPFLLHCAPASVDTVWQAVRGMRAGADYVRGRTTRGDFKARLLDLFIAGATRTQVQAWADDFAARWLRSRVRPGALTAIARHRAAGHHLVLATASFDFYARVFAERLGFDHVISTASVWDAADRLRPEIAGENCYGEEKLSAVQAYFGALSGQPRIIAYSDHSSDFGLLNWAHEGFVVNPSWRLRRMALNNNLPIIDWDKD